MNQNYSYKQIGLHILVMTILIFISNILHAQPNITRVEYYIDTDPGFGKGINVDITPAQLIENLVITINPDLLTSGGHRVFIRAKDENGSWSLTNFYFFYKPYTTSIGTSLPLLQQLEYYIDNDPGYGKGVPIALDTLTDFNNYIVPINVTGLATGAHTFWVRGLDKNGSWSMMNSWTFNVPAPLASPTIVVNSMTQTTRCARDSFDISYDATGTYNAGNVFNVEMSDKDGNFGTPTVVGSYTGTGNSIIKVKLPSHLAEGSGYKIRVSSTNPVVTGITNAQSIVIHDRPYAQTITGAGDANATYSYPYSVPVVSGSSWKWIAGAATITPTNNTADLLWNTQGQPQQVRVVETNQYGCPGDTSIKPVNVYQLKIDNVNVSSLTPCPDGNITVTASATGVYDGPNIFTAQLSDASGSFASPVNIGTVAANPVGLSQAVNINATLPKPMANGTGYRVRVISSSPSVTGSDNGQNITVDKPELGSNQTVSKCPGFTTDISSVFVTTGMTTTWDTPDPTKVDAGTYRLIVTNTNGCKDTAFVTVTDYTKPNLGADKSITISCANGTADITTLYNTNGYTNVDYGVGNPNAVVPGDYSLKVTDNHTCKDTAAIIVLDASTATVPTSGTVSETANRECTDADGWTHYYDDKGTPTDYSDDIRLLSIKKNGNNIGSVGDGTFIVNVVATTGAGSNTSVHVRNGFIITGKTFFSMNRYWNVTPTTQPSSPVGVRFYYNTQDLNDINGDITEGPVTNPNLQMYKLQDGNPDPTTNWAGATSVAFLNNGIAPSATEWVYTQLDNGRNQAEFEVNNFSGGGAGVVAQSALPVTFISFTAKAIKEGVVLQWSTATEQNSKEFDVQRSFDGVSFETVGSVSAAGNSNTTRSYSYVDRSVSAFTGRKVYYRILQVDNDGHQLLSDVRHVNLSNNGSALTLLYNPVKDEAVLHYISTENSNAVVRVIDQLGRVILTSEVNVVRGLNEIKLPTRNITKGIYMAELISNKDHGVVSFLKE